MSARDSRNTLHLIDGNAQFHRAYHAIRGLATSRGLPTNATYGFTTMLRKLYDDEAPRYIGISFDMVGPTFRHVEYAEYKAHRPRMDDDLAVQIPYVRRVCGVFRLPIVEAQGFEADDVIATLATQAVAKGMRVVVVSGDKDLLQLVSDDILVLNPGRESQGATLYDAARVEEKWGVPPERIVDVLGLVGDSVDNVPGVPGIGDKGARDLVKQFGSLEAVLENADAVKRASYREGLKANRENALLSKRLVTLRRDVPVALDLSVLERHEPDRAAAHALFSELEFTALAREYAPELKAAPMAAELEVIADETALRRVVASALAQGGVALSVLATARAPMTGRVVGLGLAWGHEAAYVPFLGAAFETGPSLTAARALDILAPLFAAPGIAKAAVSGKRDRVLLARLGHVLDGLGFDALLASYLLNPGRRHYSLGDLAGEFLGEQGAAALEPTGEEIPPLDAASRATAAEARLLARLAAPVRERLAAEGVLGIYETMELPLVRVLADMEVAGVKVDVPLLRSMSRDMQGQIERLTRDIYELAKGEFNINSPPQLREVLFDRLGLRAGKKTAKTRAASTAEDVLEELALEHPLPARILEYRSVQKLKSTYVDALPELVNAETGRIHASFNQAVAATGRISSSDPNLQNIPIRTAEGRRIRAAFIAEPGHLLLSADYSQIELRVLAHLSKDPTLIDTFRRGEDVHDRTSAEIFGALSAVPRAEQRRVSKMVNYALLYGKTAFTLAKDLGVPKKQAEEFIEMYFARYPGVQGYIDATVEEARGTGLVRTLLGRLRRLPDLQAKNFQIRMEAERQARNTPVQGSAADLIKKAMIELDAALRSRRMASRLILQIHDELLLEVPEAEAEEARAIVVERMEHAFELDVPLVVDARLGRNWDEAH